DEREPLEGERVDKALDRLDVTVVGVPADVGRLVRAAEADQVGRYDARALRERWNHLAPEKRPGRFAVQQQHGVSAAFVDVVHSQFVGVEPMRLERIVGKRGEALVGSAEDVDARIFAVMRALTWDQVAARRLERSSL